MHYVGIDHYRQYSHFRAIDSEGHVHPSGSFANLRAEIVKFLESLDEDKSVIETGRSIYKMAGILDEMETAVKIAHRMRQKR